MSNDTTTADDRFALLDLDLTEKPPVASKQPSRPAPVATATKPVEPSPLEIGKRLIDRCTTMGQLKALAGKFNGAGPDGYWFRNLPKDTADAVRLHWRVRREAFVAALLAWWPQAFALPSAPVAQQPQQQEAPVAASNSGTLIEALTNAAGEGASNAAVQGAGSMRGGQLRYVGFSSAEGYVTALRNGVKAATAESYKQTLRGQYGYTQAQIDALTVTIIPESSLPAGKGIVHTPKVNVMDLPKAERERLWADVNKTPAQKDAEAKAKAEQEEQEREQERVLIAGLVATREGLCISPGEAQKGFKIPAAEFRAALGERFEHLAPAIRTDKAQFGEVLRSLRGTGLVTYAATKSSADTDWPADVVSRYIVGRLDTSTDLEVLGSKALVADLCKVTTDEDGTKLDKPQYEIRFTGGEQDVRDRVKAEFERRTEQKLLSTTYLGGWLKDKVLRKEYHAIKWGGFWFVPGTDEHTQALVDLIELLVEGDEGKSLIGRDIGVGSTTTNDRWSRGIGRTLLADLARIVKAFEGNTADAQKRARAKAAEEGVDEAGQEIAARQAKASSEAALSRLKELDKLTTLIEGYKLLLGDEYAKVHAQVVTLREAITSCLDAGSVRAALLELDVDDEP